MNKIFVKNEGGWDRSVRIAGGSTALVAAMVSGGMVQIVLGVLGIALLGTALTGFCGIYKLLGISTCPIEVKKKAKKVKK